jgi:hypothetical protein
VSDVVGEAKEEEVSPKSPNFPSAQHPDLKKERKKVGGRRRRKRDGKLKGKKGPKKNKSKRKTARRKKET